VNEKIEIAVEQIEQIVVALDCYRDALESVYLEIINMKGNRKTETIRDTVAMSLEHAVVACNEIRHSLQQAKDTLEGQPNLRDEFLNAWRQSANRSWNARDREIYVFGYLQQTLGISNEELNEVDAAVKTDE
jgi:hypothetical protein